MILQALKEYYDRKAADPAAAMPPPNWISRGLDFAIAVDERGKYVQIECLQDIQRGKRIAKPCILPNIGKQALKHTNSGVDANLLWDNAAFVLGVGKNGETKQQSFIETIERWFKDSKDSGIIAVLSFLHAREFVPILDHHEFGEEIRSGRPSMAFRLVGDTSSFVHDRPVVRARISSGMQSETDGQSDTVCLVTGIRGSAKDCHTVIKGVWGAQPAGAPLVGFNAESFCSFAKKQSQNAPVSSQAMFAYTTALNHLLGKDSKQRMQVGDASTVFWAEKATDFEQQIADFFSEPPKDDPDRGVRAVESLFKSVQSGAFLADEAKIKFYVLGLAPNASRIAVRFWIVDTVSGMAGKICRHFEDTRIIHGPRDKDTLSLFRLLVSTATQGKAENIPPNLGGDTMRAILDGLPYPQTLLQAAIRRIRAEQGKKDKDTGKSLPNVTYERAALIKACINRSTRFNNPEQKEELKVSLDMTNTNIGYRLGRLFATLERTQIRAFTSGGGKEPNSTIRDRYYGGASGTPVAVFGTLIRLSKHHLAKIESAGERVNLEKLFGEIMNGVDDFPAHLSLADQGRFAIGYYHQMQSFFTRKSE